MKKILLLAILINSSLVFATECQDQHPSFSIDGIEQWNNKSATEIFDQAQKITLAKAKKEHDQGIALKTLITNSYQQGILAIYNCQNKNLNIEIKNLLSSNPEKSDYALSLTRKGTFKLVIKDGSQPILKNISHIKLITK